MKTKETYNFEKFKREWKYNPKDETIIFKNFKSEPEKINIDLHYKSPMYNHFITTEEFTIKVPRQTNTELGVFQVPRIHVDKDFFGHPGYYRNHVIHHEIGHYIMQTLNFSDPADIMNVSLLHHEIYDYIIDLLITEETKEQYEKYRSIAHDICSNYENNEINIKRRDLYFRLKELTASVLGQDFEKESNMYGSSLLNEIDAELFAYCHDKNINIVRRYTLCSFPKKVYKYHNKIGHVIDENLQMIETLNKIDKVIKKALKDKIVLDNLFIYYMI